MPTYEMEMPSAEDIVSNLSAVRERVSSHASKLPAGSLPPTLVAVSKTKPVELLAAAYGAGQRDFGENYVQEVVAKAPELPEDVRWHFIGHLQSNKVKDLLSVPNLYCVHTVDSIKLANEIQKRALQLRPDRPLMVFAQVNTSMEDSKSGCAPSEIVALCTTIRDNCSALQLVGLMCIGKYSAAEGGSEEDFGEAPATVLVPRSTALPSPGLTALTPTVLCCSVPQPVPHRGCWRYGCGAIIACALDGNVTRL